MEVIIGSGNLKVAFNKKGVADRLKGYQAPPSEEVQEFYQNFYASSEGQLSPLAKTRNIQFENIFQKLSPYLSPVGVMELIDIGAGRGDFVKFLKQKLQGRQTNIHGVEPACAPEDSGVKKLALEQVFSDSSLPSKFDLVFLLDVFEHFNDPHEKIKVLAQMVKPGGLICLKVPNKNGLLYLIAKYGSIISTALSKGLLSRIYQVNFPPPHFYYYDKNSLEQVIAPNFETVDTFYLSELPIRGIVSRVWGVSPLLKAVLIPCAFIYTLLARLSFADGLVIVAKKTTSK
ncbi:MAG: class I SAM-dependent methyltransferase [Bacteriovoracaceae bacterium]|jgi:2-polyprenyl-3-methyl-5-hydroxy-6-metoxy-1,4-benzoquinol methylase|nr:class I SAM-dependent methyltransferase [Bacteriovoracaceae bacterium]